MFNPFKPISLVRIMTTEFRIMIHSILIPQVPELIHPAARDMDKPSFVHHYITAFARRHAALVGPAESPRNPELYEVVPGFQQKNVIEHDLV